MLHEMLQCAKSKLLFHFFYATHTGASTTMETPMLCNGFNLHSIFNLLLCLKH
jgi:hypothetical protein